MSAEAGAGFALWKIGSLKFAGFGAALIGAGIMTIFRPPKTKKEMFLQGACALAGSFMFGNTAVTFLDSWFDWINLATASFNDAVQFTVTVHGLIGAMSWGVFGGLAAMRERIGTDPIQAIKDIKDV